VKPDRREAEEMDRGVDRVEKRDDVRGSTVVRVPSSQLT
jgi:hypothetical protein